MSSLRRICDLDMISLPGWIAHTKKKRMMYFSSLRTHTQEMNKTIISLVCVCTHERERELQRPVEGHSSFCAWFRCYDLNSSRNINLCAYVTDVTCQWQRNTKLFFKRHFLMMHIHYVFPLTKRKLGKQALTRLCVSCKRCSCDHNSRWRLLKILDWSRTYHGLPLQQI